MTKLARAPETVHTGQWCCAMSVFARCHYGLLGPDLKEHVRASYFLVSTGHFGGVFRLGGPCRQPGAISAYLGVAQCAVRSEVVKRQIILNWAVRNRKFIFDFVIPHMILGILVLKNLLFLT